MAKFFNCSKAKLNCLGLFLLSAIFGYFFLNVEATTGTGPSTSTIYIFWSSGVSGGDAVVAGVVTKTLQNLFQGDITAKPYTADSKCKHKKPEDLDCDFNKKGGNCCWYNVNNDGGSGSTNLFHGTGSPSKNKTWDLFTGTSARPDKKGFGVAVSRYSKTKIWFVSKPLDSQPGDGVVTMKHWTTPPVEVRVCARLYDAKGEQNPKQRTKPWTYLSCSKGKGYGTAPGPDEFIIKGPIKEPYELVIEMGPYSNKQGGFAFIDDIKYRFK